MVSTALVHPTTLVERVVSSCEISRVSLSSPTLAHTIAKSMVHNDLIMLLKASLNGLTFEISVCAEKVFDGFAAYISSSMLFLRPIIATLLSHDI